MLKALARVIVAFALVTSVKASLPGAIVGFWRNDNEERFTEMQLREDGSFASLSRNDAIIAIIPLQESSGTWQLTKNTLTLLPVKEEDRQGPITWTLLAVSRDCFSFSDHSGIIYTLQRVR